MKGQGGDQFAIIAFAFYAVLLPDYAQNQGGY